ncbi:MAG: hypothetical protein A2V66_06945 [Ignavibacteria bacterium RBG_13_36_8]|nr:MAG: hypothetical protein A2V66_06945 [Ignavibacteria bacterium RBG_13_36_8]
MMKNIIFGLIAVSAIALCSCEDEFDPYGDLRDKYILNCVINNDTTTQYATISKSYLVESSNPASYTEDPSISGAEIVISYNDSARTFSEETIERQDLSRYTNLARIYSTHNLRAESNTEYHLSALLPDGRRLRAITIAPPPVTFQTISDTLIPPVNKDWVAVYWQIPRVDLYVASVFKIYYFKRENGINVRYEKRVPVKYIQQGNEYIPHFPEPSYSTMIYVEMDAFTRALQEISEGDPNKENYTMLAFILEIRVYDENMTSYYAAQREVAESFTLKVDESDFSNIEGGYGIFGSYCLQRKAIKFSHAYIESFGYIPGLTE